MTFIAEQGHMRLLGRQQNGATGIVTTRSDDRARIYTAPPEPQLQTAAVVGLEQPAVALATQFVKSGFTVLGIDSDHERVRASEQSPVLRAALARRRFAASTDFSMIRRANLVVVCVDARIDSDAAVAALVGASARVAPHIDRGTVVVIEAVSPTHPVCRALASLFEHESGLKHGTDFSLLFAPPVGETTDAAARAAAIGLMYELGADTAADVPEAPNAISHKRYAVRRGRRDKRFADLLVNVSAVVDIIVIVAMLIAAFFVRFRTGISMWGVHADLGLGAYVGYIVYGVLSLFLLMAHEGVYDSRNLLHSRGITARMLRAGALWVVAYLSLALLFQFRPPISRIYVALAVSMTVAGLALWRILFRRILGAPGMVERLQKRVIFAGWNHEARRLAETFAADPASGFAVVGCVLPGGPKGEEIDSNVAPCLGTLEDLRWLLDSHAIDTVILADGGSPHLKRSAVHIATLCEQELVDFKILPSYFRIFLSGLHLETMRGTPVLGVTRLPLDGFVNRVFKRVFDIAGATIGLLISAPIIAVMGALVYLESPGPIMYRQRRFGLDGSVFEMLKIRSMRLDAESKGEVGWTREDDPRRLRVGAFMRRWNIDELPQFWNVLRGDMSVVGPRPERPELVTAFRFEIPHYQARHNIKPGITGWAQINGCRGDTDLVERINCDLFYLENWSPLLDLQILVWTPFARKNAY
jgi:exopolysaccharide biosynthesis polyprenyl glycosylphosphotransferase